MGSLPLTMRIIRKYMGSLAYNLLFYLCKKKEGIFFFWIKSAVYNLHVVVNTFQT
jgi:hypothetical protein